MSCIQFVTTQSPSPSNTPSITPSTTTTGTRTNTPTATRTSTTTRTASHTSTHTFSATQTPTTTPSYSSTPTLTPTPTKPLPTIYSSTPNNTSSLIPSNTPNNTGTYTSTPINTGSTSTPTRTTTPTQTPSRTPSSLPIFNCITDGSSLLLGNNRNSGTLYYNGTGCTTNVNIDLAGTTGGAAIIADGSGPLVFTSDITASGLGNKTLTLKGKNNNINAIMGSFGNPSKPEFLSGNGTLSLVKDDSGTWMLSGRNRYTGSTKILNGTLIIGDDVPNSGFSPIGYYGRGVIKSGPYDIVPQPNYLTIGQQARASDSAALLLDTDVTFNVNIGVLSYSGDNHPVITYNDKLSNYNISFINNYKNINIKNNNFKFGTKSFYSDGTNNAGIDFLGPFTTDSDFTIETWIYPLEYRDQDIFIISSSDVTGGLTILLQANGAISISNGVDEGPVFDSSPYVINEWQHIAVTYTQSTNTLNLFKNGILVGNTSSYNLINTGNNSTIRLGNSYGNWGNYVFKGNLDEFRYSKIVRYTEPFSPANTPFNTDSNTQILSHFEWDFDTIINQTIIGGANTSGVCTFGSGCNIIASGNNSYIYLQAATSGTVIFDNYFSVSSSGTNYIFGDTSHSGTIIINSSLCGWSNNYYDKISNNLTLLLKGGTLVFNKRQYPGDDRFSSIELLSGKFIALTDYLGSRYLNIGDSADNIDGSVSFLVGANLQLRDKVIVVNPAGNNSNQKIIIGGSDMLANPEHIISPNKAYLYSFILMPDNSSVNVVAPSGYYLQFSGGLANSIQGQEVTGNIIFGNYNNTGTIIVEAQTQTMGSIIIDYGKVIISMGGFLYGDQGVILNNGAELEINNNNFYSELIFNSGTLSGNGSIEPFYGTVIGSGAIISPGISSAGAVGSLTMNQDLLDTPNPVLTLASGGTYKCHINNSNIASVSNSQLIVNGNLDISATETDKFNINITSKSIISNTIAKFGAYSLYADGDGSYMDFWGSLGDESVDWTIEAWIYPLEYKTQEIFIISNLNLAGQGLSLLLNSNSSISILNARNDAVNFNANYSINMWQHIAVVRNSYDSSSGIASLGLYLNGVLIDTVSYNINTMYSNGSTYKIRLGGSPSNWGSYHFHGYIDEFRYSHNIRYSGNFTPINTEFSRDTSTVILAHFDKNIDDNPDISVFPNADMIPDTDYIIATSTNLTNFDSNKFNINIDSSFYNNIADSGIFSISSSGNNLILNYISNSHA
jgi:autotransporter-associated beta strand protein